MGIKKLSIFAIDNQSYIAMSKTTALYHIVFCTKQREMTLPAQFREDMYRFIWREITDSRCRLVQIGGIENHIHLLVDIHPSVTLSGLVKTIKSKSSAWLKINPNFPNFMGWAREYFASSVSPSQQGSVIGYIKSQPEHHGRTPFSEELQKLHQSAGLCLNPFDYMD